MQTDLGEPKPLSAKRVEFLFELYIVEEESRHQETRDRLKLLFDEHLPGQYLMRIINVTHEPEKAAEADVLATPTLIKLRPKPAQRVVGDLFVGASLLRELRLIPN
jgi:circadian clock protein KaiB